MSTTETGRLKNALKRIVEELDDEDVRSEFEELKNRKVTVADVLEAIREAPAEDRAELRAILAEEMEPTDGPPAPPAPPKDEPAPAPPKDEPPTPPARRKRPGRKSGAAYDWYVDDEGNVVRSPVAIIYSGEDEPDEVEMLDLPAVGDSDEGREGE